MSELKHNKIFREMVIFICILSALIAIASLEVQSYDKRGDHYIIYDERDYTSKTINLALVNNTNYIGKVNLFSESDNLQVKICIQIDGEIITNTTFVSNLYCEVIDFTYGAKSDVNLAISLDFFGDSYSYIQIEREKTRVDIINEIFEDSFFWFIFSLVFVVFTAVMWYVKKEFPFEIPEGILYETKVDRKKIISQFYALFNKYIMKDVPNYRMMQQIDKLNILREKCCEYFSFLAMNGVEFSINRGHIFKPGSGIHFDSSNKINQDYVRLKILAHLIIKINDRTEFIKINMTCLIFTSIGLPFCLMSISDAFIAIPFLVIIFAGFYLKSLMKKDAILLDARASIGSATISKEEALWFAHVIADSMSDW